MVYLQLMWDYQWLLKPVTLIVKRENSEISSQLLGALALIDQALGLLCAVDRTDHVSESKINGPSSSSSWHSVLSVSIKIRLSVSDCFRDWLL